MARKIQKIVVGVATMRPEDPKLAPPGEDPVLAAAVELAQRVRATLHVVHVLESADLGYTHAAHDSWPFQLEHREAVEHGLWEQVRRFPGHYHFIRCRVLEGAPHARLCEYAEQVEADLIVVGTTRRGWLWRNILSTTAQRVLERATLPVLVARRRPGTPVRRVLLATDVSEIGAAIHVKARETVQDLFAYSMPELRSLLVCWTDPLLLLPASPERAKELAEEKLDRFLQERNDDGVPIERKVRIGNPSTEIVWEAEEWSADLVVLGTHGNRYHLPEALGSTAAATLRRICCNALVVPVRSLPYAETAGTRWTDPGVEDYLHTEEHLQQGEIVIASP